MLTENTRNSMYCNRRSWLETSGAGLLGLSLTDLEKAQAAPNPSATLLMSPPVFVGQTKTQRDEFLQRTSILEARTVSMATPSNWTENQVSEAHHFLKQVNIRVGEFSAFDLRFASSESADHRIAMNHYRRQLQHARILNAHCVGFAITTDRGTPAVWSQDTWKRCIRAVKELAREAEQTEMNIAAHPHIMSPLMSTERYQQLLEEVASPRLKVLLDPVNLTWPQRFYQNGDMILELFDALGDAIVAVHAKDMTMSGVKSQGEFLSVVNVQEAVPGTGQLDYPQLIRSLSKLNHTVTIHVEHFPFARTVTGQQFIRHIARTCNVTIQ